MRITDADRRLARKKNHFVTQIYIDGKERTIPSGVREYVGPLSPECATELWTLVQKWLEDGRI